MLTQQSLPFGFWPANVTTTMVAGKTPRLSEPCIDGDHLYWLQTLPEEKGRATVMRSPLHEGQPSSDNMQSLLPRPLSARSKVGEYGGGSYCVDHHQLYFVLADDQQVYALDTGSREFEPQRLTTATTDFASENSSSLRYADLLLDKTGQQLIAVCEQHFTDEPQREPVTRLVSIATDGSGTVTIIAEGHDFFASPTLSPCGKYLCWLSWDHPDMPWDATQLYLTERNTDGHFSNPARHVAGDGNESLFQPLFSPQGDLFFVSDRSNWWNLYRITAYELQQTSPKATHVLPMEAEFATPQWTFRMSTYGFLDSATILACYTHNGRWHLVKILLENDGATMHPITAAEPLTVINGIYCTQGTATFIGSSPTAPPAVITLSDSNGLHYATAPTTALEAADIAIAHNVAFPTGADAQQTAYGFYYPPTNARVTADGAPPLIVICHGGPTGATESDLNLKIQYWTNRGVAVMDVNYRGSTGFGRKFRHSLHQNWGLYDVADVCAAAEHAVQQGWANPNQLIIKGSSAGGYTVLAALAFTNTFSAGVSLYGIGDLETLVRDTHKFEARYLDRLIGDYHNEQQRYYDRSPLHFVDQINCPLLVFQGLEDKVVPPNQAQAMVNAVRAKGLPVSYITFADEGHGFRNAENIEKMLEEELRFYQTLFGGDSSNK